MIEAWEFFWSNVTPWLPSPAVLQSVGAAILLVTSLGIALPDGRRHGLLRRSLATLAGVAGLVMLWWSVPAVENLSMGAGFWIFAALTLASAAATIASRSPVYCAIWFAISLLGTAALLLLQGAQFLGVATIAVYAGAIVVTFLFVLMLAQPEGHAFYDRIGWGQTPRFAASVTATVLAMVLAAAITRTDPAALTQRQSLLADLDVNVASVLPSASLRAFHVLAVVGRTNALVTVAVPYEDRERFDQSKTALADSCLASLREAFPEAAIERVRFRVEDVLSPEHTANLGGQLFTRQLITVQAAGALLLGALVGAVAIVSRGSDRAGEEEQLK